MRAVIQKVKSASVRVAEETISRIGPGLLILLGVAAEDEEKDLHYLLEKIPVLRIFEDEAGKMNRSLEEVGGEILVVSQFTLFADTKKGRRPSFVKAAPPEKGKAFYEAFLAGLAQKEISVQGRPVSGPYGGFSCQRWSGDDRDGYEGGKRMLRIITLVVGPIETNCYILHEEGKTDAFVVDPGFQGRR